MTLAKTEEEARDTISYCLKSVMENKGVFNPVTHHYLFNVMVKYIGWKESSLTPSIHTRDTQPFVFQIYGVKTKYAMDNRRRYDRLRTIGESLLFVLGFWTESILSTPTRSRPSLDYYAETGRGAYRSASQAAQYTDLSSDVVRLMHEMSRGFQRYAGVIHGVRQKFDGNRLNNLEALLELSRIIGDDALNAYALEKQLCEQVN